MGTHLYFDAGPRTSRLASGTGAPTVLVELHDGPDHVQLGYTDLDTLNETLALFIEARAKFVQAMIDGRSETVTVEQLGGDDLIVLDDDVVYVDTVVLCDDGAIVRYARKYAGTWDLTDTLTITVPRGTEIKRLTPAATLAVV